jgi:hypothetical protein
VLVPGRDLFGLTPEVILSDFTISRSKLLEWIADWSGDS